MEDVELADVTSLPVPGALVRLVQERFSGILEIGKALRVVYREGQILDVLSDSDEHDLAGVMHASGKMNAATLERFRRERDPTAPVLDELVRLGMVPAADAPKAAAWRAMSLLQAAILRTPGALAIVIGAPPEGVSPRGVDLRAVLARIWKRIEVDEDPSPRFEKFLDHYCVPLRGAGEIVSTLKLADREQGVWDVIAERPLRLREVMARSPLFRMRLFQLLDKLASLSLVALDPNPPRGAGLDLESLTKWEAALERGSPFEVLGVHPTTFPEEVERRKRRLLERFDAIDGQGIERAREVTDRMRKRVTEAAALLVDPVRRLEVRRDWYSPDQLEQFATIQSQKAESAMFWRSQFEEALALLRSAVDLAPAVPDYHAQLALAAILATGGTRDEALRALDQVIRSQKRAEARNYAIASAAAGLLRDGPRQARLAEMAQKTPGFDAAAARLLRGEGLPKR